MKFVLSLCMLSVLFLSCSTLQKNNDHHICNDIRIPANAAQCAALFPKIQKKQISQMSDSEIISYMDALVIENFKIETKEFGNESQYKIAVEYFKKDLNEIFNKDSKYKEIFKKKLKEKSANYVMISKNKSRNDREQDKAKQKNIEDSLHPMLPAKQKIIFHSIKPGKFMMGEIGSQVETIIDQPFSMMSTEFTQMMWVKIMVGTGISDPVSFYQSHPQELNPSFALKGPDSQIVKIENFDVVMKPDHPVESVSWERVSEFIIKLNNMSKSDDNEIQNLLKKIIPDHQKNDVYDLPTNEQWEFIMRDRGNANNVYFDKDNSSEMSTYAWFNENSGGVAHAVAQLLPRMIDNGYGVRQPFYDLEGNVMEWTKNLFTGDQDSPKNFRAYRGGAFFNQADFLRSGYSQGSFPGSWGRAECRGFRLARTNR